MRWIEDRREHLLASSSGTDRVAYREVAARKDGTILGMRFKWLDNVGGYIRSPEPGCSFRPTGNFVGPYRFQNLEVDASVVMTNKSLTGPNRGYACGHLYFETEGMMDRLADRLGLDPVEGRRRNLVQPDQFPYRTPTGGLYDSGDYPAPLDPAPAPARDDEPRREPAKAPAPRRQFGVGAAPAGRPDLTGSPTGSDSIRSRCAGETSCSPTSSRIAPRPAGSTTAATTRPPSTGRSRSPGTTSCGASRRRPAPPDAMSGSGSRWRSIRPCPTWATWPPRSTHSSVRSPSTCPNLARWTRRRSRSTRSGV